MKPILLGTRGSDLALAQTRFVAARLREAHPGLAVEERIIRTTGDVRLDVSLSNPGALDKGLFTKELEEALRRGEIDAAVHSLKDLPTEHSPGLTLGAILEREDPADVLVSRFSGGFDALPAGARVATGSLRRKCFLGSRRPDLQTMEIRGNVPTRLRRLGERDDLAAIVLAAAGLRRLEAAGCPLARDGFEITPLPFMLPAPGQGAIAIECRADDPAVGATLTAVHHALTAAGVSAERRVLSGLGGGCHSPLGVRAIMRAEGAMTLTAAWFADDEFTPRFAEAHGSADGWAPLADRVTQELLRARG